MSLPSSVLIPGGASQASFSVQAVGASSSTSATITATLNNTTKSFSLGVIPETTPPTAPGNVTATAVSSSQINLSWAASTDNVGVTAYLVERCQGSACTNFAEIASAAATTFSNTGLAASVTYRYRVRASDAAGNRSPYSAIVTAGTWAPVSVSVTPATASLYASQTVQFTAVVTGGSGNSAVTWTRSPGLGSVSSSGVYTAPPSIRTQQAVTVTATSVADPTKSNSATVNLLIDTTPPAAPGNVTATAASSSQINLSWTASTDNVGVIGYLVERCQGSGCTAFVLIASPSGSASSYDNTGLAAGGNYSYRIRATDNTGNQSPFSNVATASTALIAAYGFNAGTGATTADSSGNGLVGTLHGATWTNSGKYGNALSFNGTSSYVNLGNPTLLQLTGSMTLSAWVFPTANPLSDGQIIAKSVNNGGWQLKASSATGVRTFGIAISNGTTSIQRFSATVPSLNTWYHVAGVYNAATRTLDIYVNGVLDNGVLMGTVPAQQNNSAANVTIGKGNSGLLSQGAFQGTIDEVRVYDQALTQSEIQTGRDTPIGAQ